MLLALVYVFVALAPPVAKRIAHPQTVHGVTLQDDYYWLRNKDKKDVVAHLAAENAYTRAMTEREAPLRETLYREMRARVAEDDASPPVLMKGWLYYHRFERGKQHEIFCRKREGGPEIVTLDLNTIKGKYKDVELFHVTDDGQRMGYLLDTTGFRQFVLKVKDLASGKHSSEAIERVDSFVFAPDNATILYVTEDAQTKRPNKLFRHRIGADQKTDVLVYEEPDERFNLDVERARSGDWIILTSASATTSEVRVLEAKSPAEPLRVISPRRQGHEYYLDHRGDRFYIRTNDQGRNFRLVTAPVSEPSRWTELVAHDPDVMMEHILVFKEHVVRFERRRGLPQIVIDDGTLPIAEDAYDLFPGPNPEADCTPRSRRRSRTKRCR
jgi:oligopeptidase B